MESLKEGMIGAFEPKNKNWGSYIKRSVDSIANQTTSTPYKLKIGN